MHAHVNPLSHDLREMMDASGDLWDALRGARIFVTGGTGFFGRWIVESFVHANREKKLGASMVLLSRNPQLFKATAPHLFEDGLVTMAQGDVRHFIAPAGSFTHIIHAATESSSAHKNYGPLHRVDTIVDGTRHVLEFARTAGVSRMLYISSAAVYGRNRELTKPIPETDPNGPLMTDTWIDYDEAKRMAEALCAIYYREYGLGVTVARGFAFVGPHLPIDEHYAIGNFIRDALADSTIRINGDGTPVRSYLYASDLARWLWAILLKGAAAQAYNVGSHEAVSVAELGKKVQKVVNPKVKVEVLGKPVRGARLNYQVPDVSKAEKELGLKVTVPLAEAIRRTAEWNRQNPKKPKEASISAPSILAKPDLIVFDFDGVMTDNRVEVNEEGKEAVFCNRSDGMGVEMLRKCGVPMLVLSKEKNPVVAMRCKKLQLECIQGIDVKETRLQELLVERGLSAARTIYLGNDINDVECMRMVGFPVAVGDAYPAAKAVAALVLSHNGGHGAVRELADRILSEMKA